MITEPKKTEQKTIMTVEQENELSKLRNEIEEGFKNLYIFRSEFLMRNSVLAMQATLDGKYWQAILERNVHFWELVRLDYDYKIKIAEINIKKAIANKKDDEIKKTEDELNKAIINAETEKLKIEIEKEDIFLIHMRKEAEQRLREIKTWTKIINELKSQLKYSPDNPEEYQAEEWANIYSNKLKILDKIGQTDMNGAMNIYTVAKQIFSDSEVIRLCEVEQNKLKEKEVRKDGKA